MACPESRLKCFLHYGCEDYVYIPSKNVENNFHPEKVQSVIDLLSDADTDKNVVPLIMKVFRSGYIVEPCASFYALALVVRRADRKTRSKIICEAYKAARKLSEDNAEYFLTFTSYLREIAKSNNKKGFGKGWRTTVDKWYSKTDSLSLAKAVCKTTSVHGWNHKDMLSLCHLKPPSDDAEKAAVLTFIKKGYEVAQEKFSNEAGAKDILVYLMLVDQIRRAGNDAALINLILTHEFTVENCPSQSLTNHEIWRTLIPRMSIESLLANLNRMSKYKMFRHREIVQEIMNRCVQAEVDMGNVHPFYVHVVRKHYEEGPNLAIEFQYLQRRRLLEAWVEGGGDDNSAIGGGAAQQNIQRQPPPRRSPEILDSLSSLFVKSLMNLAPTGLRYLIVLDQTAAVASKKCYLERFVTVEEASLLVTLSTIKAEIESNVKILTFTKVDEGITSMKEIPFNKTEETLESLKTKLNTVDVASANLSIMFEWATRMDERYDVFIVLSDNNLSANGVHDALKKYQEKISTKAKLITCCFTGPHSKVTELTKPSMFLVCGFDKNVGRLIEAYSRGSF